MSAEADRCFGEFHCLKELGRGRREESLMQGLADWVLGIVGFTGSGLRAAPSWLSVEGITKLGMSRSN